MYYVLEAIHEMDRLHAPYSIGVVTQPQPSSRACKLEDKGHMGGGLDILQLFHIHHRLILGHHILNLDLEVHEPEEGKLIG